MSNKKTTGLHPVTIAAFVVAMTLAKNSGAQLPAHYQPVDPALYDSIVRLDSLFFEAYNTCNIEKQAAFYSDSIEFYHDYGGLTTSKQEILEATKRNICGKVTRTLVKGSLEVYPLKGYGAVEIGLHQFHNNTEKEGTPSKAGRFIIIWQHKNNQWTLRRVISLH